MQEYESTEALIKNLGNEIDKTNSELSKVKAQMEKLEGEWLVPLGNLVNEINLKFSNSFARMECSSELSICTGEIQSCLVIFQSNNNHLVTPNTNKLTKL